MSGIFAKYLYSGNCIQTNEWRKVATELEYRVTGDSVTHRICDKKTTLLVGLSNAQAVHTMFVSSSELSICVDGEIINRTEILQKLDRRGSFCLEGHGDAELLLLAYLNCGVEVFSKVIGTFSAVIWDGRNNTLFCIRDVLGIKPIYYLSLIHISEPTRPY